MKKSWVIVVLGECGWSRFDAGFFDNGSIAHEQARIYAARYPEKSFMVISR